MSEPPGPELETALRSGEFVLSRSAFESASPAMQSFVRLLGEAAHHEVAVLLVGEMGTGKTTFARALHAMSRRAKRRYVRVDCPAAGGDLSSEAYAARSGTLFLDEVVELPLATQASALRILQGTRRVPFRLVASTRHDLEVELAAGRFRKDLYYRLNVLELRIPPLRERAEDILPIARALLSSLARSEGRPAPALTPQLEQTLIRYSWPGNVQELLSVLQRMLIFSPGPSLDVAALPDRVSG